MECVFGKKGKLIQMCTCAYICMRPLRSSGGYTQVSVRVSIPDIPDPWDNAGTHGVSDEFLSIKHV